MVVPIAFSVKPRFSYVSKSYDQTLGIVTSTIMAAPTFEEIVMGTTAVALYQGDLDDQKGLTQNGNDIRSIQNRM